MKHQKKIITISVFVLAFSLYKYFEKSSQYLNDRSDDNQSVRQDSSNNSPMIFRKDRIKVQDKHIGHKEHGQKHEDDHSDDYENENEDQQAIRNDYQPTEKELAALKVFNKRNPHFKNTKLRITHEFPNRGTYEAIITKNDLVTFTAIVEKKTGKILKTWGRTHFEYRKDLEKLDFQLPQKDD
jgi:hypothetical protein